MLDFKKIPVESPVTGANVTRFSILDNNGFTTYVGMIMEGSWSPAFSPWVFYPKENARGSWDTEEIGLGYFDTFDRAEKVLLELAPFLWEPWLKNHPARNSSKEN